MMNLYEQFGAIDIHVFDQLLKGRITPGMRVMDAGCGGGRNLVFMLRNGFDVWGVDAHPEAIAAAESLARELAPALPPGRFRTLPVEDLDHPDAFFDVVLCSAVLHFARDEAQFLAMLRAMARVLRPGGLFFARLMGTHGVEHLVHSCGNRLHLTGDGSMLFLTDEDYLRRCTNDVFRGALVDPLKSTVVHGQRTMMTWVLQRGL